MTNKMQLMMVNANAELEEIIPDGISLTAVRGFNLSICWSVHRLNDMAALRANTIHNNTLKAILGSN